LGRVTADRMLLQQTRLRKAFAARDRGARPASTGVDRWSGRERPHVVGPTKL